MTTKISIHTERFSDQYFYTEPVGTYLIDLKDKILLFDLPTYSTELKEYLEAKNKPVYALLSHGSCGIEDGKKWQKELEVKVFLHEADKNHEWLRMKPDVLFSEMPSFDENLQVIHTPGHSPGSVCLLDKSTGALFTGDTFGGTAKGEVRDFQEEDHRYDDIPLRLESCRELLNLDFDTVLPFHYEMINKNGKKALEKYLKVY